MYYQDLKTNYFQCINKIKTQGKNDLFSVYVISIVVLYRNDLWLVFKPEFCYFFATMTKTYTLVITQFGSKNVRNNFLAIKMRCTVGHKLTSKCIWIVHAEKNWNHLLSCRYVKWSNRNVKSYNEVMLVLPSLMPFMVCYIKNHNSKENKILALQKRFHTNSHITT